MGTLFCHSVVDIFYSASIGQRVSQSCHLSALSLQCIVFLSDVLIVATPFQHCTRRHSLSCHADPIHPECKVFSQIMRAQMVICKGYFSLMAFFMGCLSHADNWASVDPFHFVPFAIRGLKSLKDILCNVLDNTLNHSSSITPFYFCTVFFVSWLHSRFCSSFSNLHMSQVPRGDSQQKRPLIVVVSWSIALNF